MLDEYTTNSQNDVAAGFNPESEVQKAAQDRLRQQHASEDNSNRQLAGNALGIIGSVIGGLIGGPAGAAIGGIPGKAIGGKSIPGLDQLSAVLGAPKAAPDTAPSLSVPTIKTGIDMGTNALDKMEFGAGLGL
jgi:hypothetical protein